MRIHRRAPGSARAQCWVTLTVVGSPAVVDRISTGAMASRHRGRLARITLPTRAGAGSYSPLPWCEASRCRPGLGEAEPENSGLTATGCCRRKVAVWLPGFLLISTARTRAPTSAPEVPMPLHGDAPAERRHRSARRRLLPRGAQARVLVDSGLPQREEQVAMLTASHFTVGSVLEERGPPASATTARRSTPSTPDQLRVGYPVRCRSRS